MNGKEKGEVCVYTAGYCQPLGESYDQAARWINLEGTTLTVVSQTQIGTMKFNLHRDRKHKEER